MRRSPFPGPRLSLLVGLCLCFLDVNHLREVEAVLLRGRFLDREALDGLLDEARKLVGG
jgi:hypothetical protein